MKNQRALTTKRLLREGLFRLLKAKQLDKITITELCQESGINRVTFYNHYALPREILVELEEEMVKELQCYHQSPLTPETVLPCLEAICQYLHSHKEMVKILIHYNTDTELTNFMNDISKRFRTVEEHLLQMESVDSDTAKLTTTFLGSGSYFLLAQWITEDIPKTPKEIANLIYAIVYNHK